jgi:hypothetical protein
MTKLIGRVTERSYYDYFPPSTHAPGDIWMHLPTHGLLRRDRASALVVTPSCDLSNRKVNTITYLPIISFLDWVSCRDFLPEVIGSMSSLAEQLGPLGISSSSALNGDETFSTELSEQLQILDHKLANEKIAKHLRNACERYVSGGKHLKRVSGGEPANVHDLEVCLTKTRWQQLKSQVVKNALRSDLYFLPADGNDADMSPVAKHSVTLFRYPLTAPVTVLDSAQDTSLSDWPTAAEALATHEPMARAFSNVRPFKCLRLQDRFLSDLLTKFVALYSRLGSPDFSQESVETISRELGESK